jgi:mono/diheme cytochrome c family protein
MSIAQRSRQATVRAGAALAALATLALIPASPRPASTRAQSRVDFARDVQPLLKERCYECHGPTKQMNGSSWGWQPSGTRPMPRWTRSSA